MDLRANKLLAILTLSLIAAIGVMQLAVGEPVSPTLISKDNSTRGYTPGAKSTPAQAGNVTELTINVTSITNSWAGFYGNVRGVITLDDAANNTMYDWSLGTITGEVFAVDSSSVDWSSTSLVCANESVILSEQSDYDISPSDSDNFSRTFSYLNSHPSFTVGSKTFAENTCNYTMSTYVNDAADASRTFNETVIYDRTNKNVVYVALLVDDQDGFMQGTNDLFDFQMLVPDNGTDPTPTTYYFYVELA